MEVGSFKFHRRAVMALNQLDAKEKSQAMESLARLANTPAGQWPGAKRLPGEPPLYVVPTSSDNNLRAVIQLTAGQEPKVMDIVYQETLDFFAKSTANSQH